MNKMANRVNRRLPTSMMFCIVLMSLLPAAAFGQTVSRGPYLQSGTPSSVVVRWRTSSSTDSVVRYGITQGSLTQTATVSGNRTDHAVTVSGLAADTKYFYSVGNSAGTLAGNDASHFVVTSPNTGTAKDTRLWILGDSGTANSNARAVRDAFLSFTGTRNPDLLLMLGDNAYNEGTDNEHQAAVFDMYPTTLRNTVLWPTIGNHEARSSSNSNAESGPYYDIFTLPRAAEAGGIASGTEAYYSFDYGNIHFVCLESYEIPRSATGAMMTWLEADLSANLQPWVIAYWHHPPYSKGSHDSDSEGRMIDMREIANPILESWGADLVLTGHSHSYERSFLIDGHYGSSGSLVSSMIIDGGDGRPAGNGAYQKPDGPSPNDGAVYVVAGSSGQISGVGSHPAMFISLNQLGSMVVDINVGQLDASFLNSSGNVTDTFTISKSPPPDPVCGNNVIETGELCDGSALGGETCFSQGFIGGSLACNATCTAFDTTSCTALGNCSVAEFFENGLGGWSNSAASTCNTGTFVVATPTQQSSGTPAVTTQVGGDHTTGTGNALFTATNTAAGVNDVDGGNCIVESPVYNVPVASDLSLWYFHGQRDNGDDPAGDFFRVEASVNGNPFQLVNIGDATTTAVWTEVTLGVPANSTVQIRVEASDGSIGDIVEGGVDDLVICESTGGPVCGNQVAEAGELCDGADLAGESCVSQGFGGGTLSCNATCDGFDTSACTPVNLCGNNVIDAGELCDGTDLGGESCVSLGFGGGTLSCDASCSTFVTSSCTPPQGGCLHDVDFESGLGGWINGSDTCNTGSFVLGSPNATAWQVAGGAGGSANAYYTQPNTAIGTVDVDGGTCEALSPVINTAGQATVSVSLDYFHGQRDAGDDAADGLVIEVINSATSAVLATLVNLGDGVSNPAWTPASATVNNPPAGIRLRVRASDPTPNGDIIEGGVDNIQVCPPAGGAVCGNNVSETGEACDGTDLNGESCVSQGFGGGTLSCQSSCGAFDTSACTAPSEQILVENASGNDKVEVNQGQKGAQSFRVGSLGDPDYFLTKVVLYLSRDLDAPSENLTFTVGTGVNSGLIVAGPVTVTPAQVTNLSEGDSFTAFEITLPSSGPLSAGSVYYLNLEAESSNGKKYYLEYDAGAGYSGGTYFKDGGNDSKDLRFQIWGTN